MPDQPSQSLIQALLGHFRSKGQEMADKPMWGETQWLGPEDYNYIPFPQKGSNAADAGLGAILALGGLSSRAGNSAGWASNAYRAHPYETPADVQAALSRLPPSPERDARIAEANGNAARMERAVRRGGSLGAQDYELMKQRAAGNEFYPANDAARARPTLVRE